MDIPVSPANTKSTEPRYRYYEEAPENITVALEELLVRIPAEYLGSSAGIQSGRTLELPCGEIFNGNTPRLRLGLLHDLIPELVRPPADAERDHPLPLPAGWLALHFRLITRREELPPEPKEEEAVVEKPEEESAVSADSPEEPKVEIIAEEEKKESAQSPAAESVVVAEVTALAPIPEIAKEEVKEVGKKRGFFASLPIFRRRESEAVVVEEVALIMDPAIEPEPVPVPVPVKEQPKDETLPIVEIEESELKQAPKEVPPPKESMLTLERLWKLDPEDQFADPDALQALFMTDEKLTLERVIALAGQLPGLRACVLAHGPQVVCASNTPSGIDLRALSAQAATMLSQIRDSSSQMGLGAVPAITLHAEQGVLSFLYQGELCLLVLHADRGFIPGVRERLQEMLGHLSSATALPDGPSPQPSLPI